MLYAYTVFALAYLGNRATRSFMHKCISACAIFLAGKKRPACAGRSRAEGGVVARPWKCRPGTWRSKTRADRSDDRYFSGKEKPACAGKNAERRCNKLPALKSVAEVSRGARALSSRQKKVRAGRGSC